MKKHPYFSSSKTALLLCGCLAILTLLSSCENFLKSKEVAQDIKDVIAYNNAPEYTILLKSTDNQLSFLSANEKIIKLGYSAQVDFTVNTEDFLFSRLEAVCKSDTSISRDDCVKLEYIEEDAKKGMYKVKITLLKAKNDIQIQPVCFEYPKVVSYSPSETQMSYSNMPVIINFNVPVDDSVTNQIELYNKDSDVSSFFEPAQLSPDKKTVTINPKPVIINNYMRDEEINSFKVEVTIQDSVTSTVGETILPLKKNENQNFTITYQPQTDYNAPIYKPGSFFVTRTPLTASTDIDTVEKLSEEVFIFEEGIHDNTEVLNQGKAIYDNIMGSHIYLYGNFSDKESGIGTITVYEEYRGSTYNYHEDYALIPTNYTANSDNIQFYTDNDGNTSFYIDHTLKADDGAVILYVAVSDICGNETVCPDKIIGFKSTLQTILSQLYIYNSLSSKTELSQSLRTIELNYIQPKLYGLEFENFSYAENPIDLDDTNFIRSITCTTSGKTKNQNFSFNGIDEGWTITLDEGEKLSGLTILFIFTDFMGDTFVKEYSIPPSENLGYILSKEGNNSYAQFYYTSGETIKEAAAQRIPKIGDYTIIVTGDNNSILLENDYSYRPLPCCLFERDDVFDIDLVYFYSEYPEGISIDNNFTISPPQDFPQDNYPDTGKRYKLQKDEIPNIMNVYVKIPQAAWNDCTSIRALIEEKAIIYSDDDYEENHTSDLALTLTKGQKEFSFRAQTTDLFNSPCNITLYGINNKYIYQTLITIPQLTASDTTYDNNPPKYYAYRNYTKDSSNAIGSAILTDGLNFEKTKITIQDNESLIKKAYFIEGTGFYNKYGNNFNVISNMLERDPLPTEIKNKTIYKASGPSNELFIDADSWFLKNGYSYYISDMAGNVICGSTAYKSPIEWYTNSVNVSGNNLTISQKKKTGNNTRNYAYVYELNGSNWLAVTEKAGITAGNMSLSGLGFTIDKTFIKVYTSALREISLENNFEYSFSCPFYAYRNLGSTLHSPADDFLLPNGNGKESVAIISKHPVLVQTLVSCQPYDVCKDWDYAEWINMSKDIQNEQILPINSENLSSGTSQTKQYTIITKDIPSGSCYCVIAHFADGHALISNVVEKK